MSAGKRAPFAFFMFAVIVGALFLVVWMIDGKPKQEADPIAIEHTYNTAGHER
jgi:hypothetical protein